MHVEHLSSWARVQIKNNNTHCRFVQRHNTYSSDTSIFNKPTIAHCLFKIKLKKIALSLVASRLSIQTYTLETTAKKKSTLCRCASWNRTNDIFNLLNIQYTLGKFDIFWFAVQCVHCTLHNCKDRKKQYQTLYYFFPYEIRFQYKKIPKYGSEREMYDDWYIFFSVCVGSRYVIQF